jgi:peroxiredoxin Q/BCP
MLEVGTTAPIFELDDHNGVKTSLEDFRGKWVLLWWYPIAGTPGWTIQGGGLRDRAPEFADANAVILGASFDTVEAQKSFVDKENFPYQLLADPDQVAGAAYEVVSDRGFPFRHSYLINQEGVIAKSYDMKGHPDLALHAGEVLADIASLSQ